MQQRRRTYSYYVINRNKKLNKIRDERWNTIWNIYTNWYLSWLGIELKKFLNIWRMRGSTSTRRQEVEGWLLTISFCLIYWHTQNSLSSRQILEKDGTCMRFSLILTGNITHHPWHDTHHPWHIINDTSRNILQDTKAKSLSHTASLHYHQWCYDHWKYVLLTYIPIVWQPLEEMDDCGGFSLFVFHFRPTSHSVHLQLQTLTQAIWIWFGSNSFETLWYLAFQGRRWRLWWGCALCLCAVCHTWESWLLTGISFFLWG